MENIGKFGKMIFDLPEFPANVLRICKSYFIQSSWWCMNTINLNMAACSNLKYFRLVESSTLSYDRPQCTVDFTGIAEGWLYLHNKGNHGWFIFLFVNCTDFPKFYASTTTCIRQPKFLLNILIQMFADLPKFYAANVLHYTVTHYIRTYLKLHSKLKIA